MLMSMLMPVLVHSSDQHVFMLRRCCFSSLTGPRGSKQPPTAPERHHRGRGTNRNGATLFEAPSHLLSFPSVSASSVAPTSFYSPSLRVCLCGTSATDWEGAESQSSESRRAFRCFAPFGKPRSSSTPRVRVPCGQNPCSRPQTVSQPAVLPRAVDFLSRSLPPMCCAAVALCHAALPLRLACRI